MGNTLTFRHGGKKGDCVFALPCIRELGGGILYLPDTTPDDCNGLYSGLKDLLLLQHYIKEVREYPSGLPYMKQAPGIHIDYDMDLARLQPLKGVVHIVKRYLDHFHVNLPTWKDPWLVVDDVPAPVNGEYVVINYTGRHIYNEQMQMTSKVDWKKVVESIKEKIFFIGTKEEHRNFEAFAVVDHLPTNNMLEVARIVRDAKAVYCNQSSVLAIAQGLGKPYYLDVKPQKLNCLLQTSIEHILR